MHLTCTNMPREKIDIALEAAKAAGMFFSDLSE
jgi:5,10-methylenetetrahydrofolate reductase